MKNTETVVYKLFLDFSLNIFFKKFLHSTVPLSIKKWEIIMWVKFTVKKQKNCSKKGLQKKNVLGLSPILYLRNSSKVDFHDEAN